MLLLRPDPNFAVVEFTVNNFVSLRQGGTMLTSGPNPDVVTSLSANTTPPRVTQLNNNAFAFDRAGRPPITIAFAVFPSEEYAAVDLIVQRVTPDDDGGGVWDRRIVGNGPNDNVVYAKNTGRPDSRPEITYAIYLLVRRRQAGADYPFGDIGVIDPLWTNR